MKTVIASTLVLTMALPLSGQHIESLRADRMAVHRVATTANHLTVIEFAEPVVMAATGSPAFKIERQGNKVLIQPIEEEATTNLFIWTASGRFSYELVPAPSIETAVFAIDQQPYAPEKKEQPVENGQLRDIGTPIHKLAAAAGDLTPPVTVSDVIQKGDQLLIHYDASIASRPEVYELKSPGSASSLGSIRFTQLSERNLGSIRGNNRRRVPIMDSKAPIILESGDHLSGTLTLAYKPKGSDPAVLQLVFHSGDSKPVSVILVL